MVHLPTFIPLNYPNVGKYTIQKTSGIGHNAKNGPTPHDTFWPPSINLTNLRGSSWSDWKRWIRWLPKCYAAWIRRLAAIDVTDCWPKKSSPPAARKIGSETSISLMVVFLLSGVTCSSPTRGSILCMTGMYCLHWCNDVLPYHFTRTENTPPLICSGSPPMFILWFSGRAFCFLLCHLLSSIDLHKT